MTTSAIDLTDVSREEALIRALLSDSAFPHPVDNIRLLNTHISWVILTGPYAYKIKKPLELEFLDYSTLARRKHFCEEELRLNGRWAPELYVDVVAITGSFDAPRVGGEGEPIEYAVRMHQFPQQAQLDIQLDKGLLDEEDMLALADMIAGKHESAEVCRGLGTDDAQDLIRHPMLENIEHLRGFMRREDLEPLATWTAGSLDALWPALLRRQEQGFVRECHGDLKLANLVRLPSGIAAFDSVEFSAALRDIDVISDVSFLVMDLVSYDREDLAYRFLNRYLECTGDYGGMSLFALYYVYHALIRAKIAAIRSVERELQTDAEIDLEEMRYYCDVARHWAVPRVPRLVLMHGYSGSGKTWLSSRLHARMPAISVRSDIERKRMLGLPETERTGAAVGAGAYAPAARQGVYARLAGLADSLLAAGHHVIVDASFLDRRDRDAFYELARHREVSVAVVDVCARDEELLQRLKERALSGSDASEADIAVLGYQHEHADPLDEEELRRTIAVGSDSDVDIDRLIFEVLAEPVEP
jgi:aminoglycoside phosphotransferase family enzyme/predicted kinase